MKIAICFSGFVRTLDSCYSSLNDIILKPLMEKHDVDIFGSFPNDKILSSGFSFQWELLYLCCLLNANIGEIHINYKLTNSSLNKKIILESIRVLGHYVACEFFKKIYWKKQ